MDAFVTGRQSRLRPNPDVTVFVPLRKRMVFRYGCPVSIGDTPMIVIAHASEGGQLVPANVGGLGRSQSGQLHWTVQGAKRSIGGEIRCYLSSAEGQARLVEFFAEHIVPHLPKFVERLKEVATSLVPHLARISELADAWNRLPPSGYEPLLIEIGYEPLPAKVIAHAICRVGVQWAEERNSIEKPLGSAFRKLARASNRSTLAVSRCANDLKPLLDDSASQGPIERALELAGLSLTFGDVLTIVGDAAEGRKHACGQLHGLARAVVRHVPDPRGRRISTATGVHAFLLYELQLSGRPHAYAWSEEEGDFVDAATKASREVVGHNDFDPRPAYRLVKSGAFRLPDIRSL